MKKVFGLALVLCMAGAALAQTALRIGDTAPPVETKKWVKGTPLKNFDKNKIYVVEFWATWCGPCKVSIPHLTEMAHKYKDKVSFNGISIWEESNPLPTEEAYQKRVDEFVKEWAGKMDYNVGAGGMKAKMSDTWMTAAGRNGIPSAFVVQNGKVVWMGHPMDGLDETLSQIIAGTYDMNAFAAKMKKEQDDAAAAAARMKPYRDAMKAKDYKTALAEIEKLMATDTAMEKAFAMTKFNLLLRTDEPAAYTYGKELATGIYQDEPMALNSIAWAIVDDKTVAKTPDFAAAVAIAAQGAEKVKEDSDAAAFMYDTYAYALYKSGDLDKAIAFEQKAIAAANRTGSQVDADTKKEIGDRLEMLKKKKSGGK